MLHTRATQQPAEHGGQLCHAHGAAEVGEERQMVRGGFLADHADALHAQRPHLEEFRHPACHA
jgi:hypothetical protein